MDFEPVAKRTDPLAKATEGVDDQAKHWFIWCRRKTLRKVKEKIQTWKGNGTLIPWWNSRIFSQIFSQGCYRWDNSYLKGRALKPIIK